jgi:hypothetical protein
MAITSYSDLQSTIADYLARSDLTAQIPTFIQFAETRLRRDLKIRQMLKVVTTATTANDATISLPSDFLQMRDIHLVTTPIQALNYVTPTVFYRNTDSTSSGKPSKYTLLDTDFQLAPIPDSAYTVKMLYYAAPTFLSSLNTSNVFLANCPDLLLYASLAEAEPYIMNDARLQTWAALYQQGISAITSADDAGEYAGNPLTITLTAR